MITAARFFGGARLVELGAGESEPMHPSIARWYSVNATADGAWVILPEVPFDVADTRLGWGHLFVAAVGFHDITIKDSDGASVATVVSGHCAIVSLVDKTDPGTWRLQDLELEPL